VCSSDLSLSSTETGEFIEQESGLAEDDSWQEFVHPQANELIAFLQGEWHNPSPSGDRLMSAVFSGDSVTLTISDEFNVFERGLTTGDFIGTERREQVVQSSFWVDIEKRGERLVLILNMPFEVELASNFAPGYDHRLVYKVEVEPCEWSDEDELVIWLNGVNTLSSGRMLRR
jgi:hypothetical protein